MKSILGSFLLSFAALLICGQILPGVSFAKGYQTLAQVALVLSLMNLFIRPLVNILLLPINLLTLGAFRWLVNVLSLFLVTLVVPEFTISGFFFPGFSYQGFVLPATDIGPILSLVFTSLLLSLLLSFFNWVFK